MSLEAIIYRNGKLKILDQLLLPHDSVYMDVLTIQDGFNAIKNMNVRGAPAIGIVAVLSVAVELEEKQFQSINEIIEFVSNSLDYLITSRPTAVNIAYETEKLKATCATLKLTKTDPNEFKRKLLDEMISILEKDVATNRSIGLHGANHILADKTESEQTRILTICNTGSLATGGYGTALGVIRKLHELNRLEHVYFTETRPYNQGSRLTAYELVYEKIPSTLICDNMAGLLMSRRNISAIVVGADRVTSNGDTANKIGTYQLAILAKHFQVPFYVAAPTTSIDLNKKHGMEIVIEERAPNEMTHINGIRIAAPGVNCWNPAFDVTPNELITGGIITEHGVFKPEKLESSLRKLKF